MDTNTILILVIASVLSGVIAFVMTPPIRALAKRVGAVDVPEDSRRMHKKPIPRMGGLAIFLGFTAASFLFAQISSTLLAIWLGGLIIVAMGVIDDIFRVHPFVKFLIQIAAALIVVAHGLTIDFIRVFDYYIVFDAAAIPVTVIWIVCLTNAMNLIDGLDGLASGIAAIASLSLTVVTFLKGDSASALLFAVLFGACVGFLPFNRYPAKVFMGDTGSQFLGFLLAVLSLSGLFKMHAVISFFVPAVIFALPLFDTTFAFFRRLFTGKNPFHGDRGHLHHRLIDLGYTQKETVSILHAICGVLSISAILFSLKMNTAAGYTLIISALILWIYLFLMHPRKKPAHLPADSAWDDDFSEEIDENGTLADDFDETFLADEDYGGDTPAAVPDLSDLPDLQESQTDTAEAAPLPADLEAEQPDGVAPMQANDEQMPHSFLEELEKMFEEEQSGDTDADSESEELPPISGEPEAQEPSKELPPQQQSYFTYDTNSAGLPKRSRPRPTRNLPRHRS